MSDLESGKDIIKLDFIQKADATGDDEGKIVLLEADGKIHPDFTDVGVVVVEAGEAIDVSANPLPVYIDKSDDKLYKYSDYYNGLSIVGFAITSAAAAGESVIVKTLGVVDGFSGLLPGRGYYLQRGTPTITTTPDNPASLYSWSPVLVGVALTPTILLLKTGVKTFTVTHELRRSVGTSYTDYPVGFNWKVARFKIFGTQPNRQGEVSTTDVSYTEGVFLNEGNDTWRRGVGQTYRVGPGFLDATDASHGITESATGANHNQITLRSSSGSVFNSQSTLQIEDECVNSNDITRVMLLEVMGDF